MTSPLLGSARSNKSKGNNMIDELNITAQDDMGGNPEEEENESGDEAADGEEKADEDTDENDAI